MTFTPEIYEQIREGAKRSAATIVPLVYSLLEPRTVADVGCGEGWFAREFAAHGCRVLAVDREVEPHQEKIRTSDSISGLVVFFPSDLLGYWRQHQERVELAVCLEVAEHLPPESADDLIGTLCAAAPVVLFSAAIPGQGGHGHLNEQWPAYWVEKFNAHGFEVSGELRWHIWGSEVEPWYQQNLLVAAHHERARTLLSEYAVNHGLNQLFGEYAFDDPIPVVHPTTFAYWVEIAKAGRA